MKKHIPQRTCAGCRAKKSKEELLRFTKSILDLGSGNLKKVVVFDRNGKLPGRGVYVCKSLDCLKKIQKIRKLERTFSCQIEDSFYKAVEQEVFRDE